MPKKPFKLDESDKGIVIRNIENKRVGFVKGRGKRSRIQANTLRDMLNRAFDLG